MSEARLLVEPAGPPVEASRTLVLVGNPNVGKSVLFGALTGKYATVSNYPGTTVELSRGTATLGGVRWQVIDTPGTDSLLPLSEDGRVTRDVLLEQPGCVVLQVCDAKNLRRGLLLTAQLAEASVRLVLALNMTDEATARGIRIDCDSLSRKLGVPVVETVAVERRGVPQLIAQLENARPAQLHPAYGAPVEAAGTAASRVLPETTGLSPRTLALMALAGDESLGESLQLGGPAIEQCDQLRRSLSDRAPALRQRFAGARAASVDPICRAVFDARSRSPRSPLARALDVGSVHPVWGLPLLIAVLYVCYQFVGVLGAKVAVDFLEGKVFHDRLVPLFAAGLRWAIPDGAVLRFLSSDDGLILGRYGLFSMGLSYAVALVLPIVATFFIAFSLLEDSGYLPRLAVMSDKLFRAMGLNGKAVLPMVLGLGCDTMATVTARILPTRKERILVTLLLALGVPCSAQLAVIFAMLATVRPAASAWFGGTILIVLFAVGFIAAKLIPGDVSPFVLELPPLRVPSAGNVLIKTVARVQWYLREALPLFLLGTLVLWGLDRTGGLSKLESFARPVVTGLLGLPADTAGSFLVGFLRRDYGAAGLFARYQPALANGTVTRSMEIEIVVALVTLTLFLPCIANLFMILKERGAKTGAAIIAFVMPFAFLMGGLVNFLMRRLY